MPLVRAHTLGVSSIKENATRHGSVEQSMKKRITGKNNNDTNKRKHINPPNSLPPYSFHLYLKRNGGEKLAP